MAINDEDEKAENLKSRFSGLHIRTYEAELLISGVVIFALVQVAPHVTRFFETLQWRLEGHQRMMAIFGQTYLSLVIYGLIGAFLLHLILRAFWIGLLGLESVFPDGVRWDEFKAGPLFKANARREMGPLSTTIDRFDDLCSLIFSFGFMIVVVFLYSVVLLLVCSALALLASNFVFGKDQYPRIFWGTFALIFAIQLLGAFVDRIFGARIDPNGIVGRITSLVIAIGWAISPNRWIGQIQFTLQSNTSNTRVSIAIMSVMHTLGFGFIGVSLIQEGVIRFDDLVYFPNSLREDGVDAQHYRALHPPDVLPSAAPSIQNDVIDGPYLILSIPYHPRRHNPLMRKQCPDVEPFKASGLIFGRGEPPEASAVHEALNCLATLFPVKLDGKMLNDLIFDFTREGGNQHEAIVSYIPIAGLEAGRHELVVSIPSREMAKGEEDALPQRHVIPFWR